MTSSYQQLPAALDEHAAPHSDGFRFNLSIATCLAEFPGKFLCCTLISNCLRTFDDTCLHLQLNLLRHGFALSGTKLLACKRLAVTGALCDLNRQTQKGNSEPSHLRACGISSICLGKLGAMSMSPGGQRSAVP